MQRKSTEEENKWGKWKVRQEGQGGRRKEKTGSREEIRAKMGGRGWEIKDKEQEGMRKESLKGLNTLCFLFKTCQPAPRTPGNAGEKLVRGI